ncbi:MAG: alkaline phosphatase family protein, partial [Flavobacteriales bacterium]|nr:alkaline phosphatase family protein [Flavobacteriales bacterium]
MKKLLFIVLASTSGLIWNPTFCQTGDSRVLIIGIDGLRSDCLEAAETPAIDELIADGLFSPDALNNDITYSGPGWSAMLCGVWSESHGVTSNNFTGSNFEGFPSFMNRIEEENPNLNTHSICHWSPINDYILGDDVDEALNVSTDAGVADAAMAILQNGNPHALFLHFDDVDITGHGYGFDAGVAQYMGAIETTDGYVAEVISALTNRPNYEDENWLILLSTDHGGIGVSHGGSTIEEETIFFIASGAAVANEVIVKDTLEILPPPANCIAPGAAELDFEGNGDVVYVEDSPSLQLGLDQDFTLEVRIRTEATPDVAIIGNKDWDSGFNPGFVFSFEYPNGPAWKVNIGDGNERADANGAAGIADGQWHTLSCSFDRDGMMRLYTDGVFSSEEDISDIGAIDVGNGWFFGSDIFGAYSYSGAIAEVRFWHEVLSDEAIFDWHCSSLDAAHPSWESLQGHWALTEGTGLEVSNSANNGLVGAVQGAEWQQPESLITFDYSNTPRIVDMAVTAMDHLCLDINPNWNLDGISWIDGCNSANLAGVQRDEIKTIIFPNPGSEDFQITGIPSHASIEVFHPNGKSIHH